jgi:hypothetical protein
MAIYSADERKLPLDKVLDYDIELYLREAREAGFTEEQAKFIRKWFGLRDGWPEMEDRYAASLRSDDVKEAERVRSQS